MAAAVTIVAMTILTLQIALTRLLSASVSYHAAFAVIAAVMLGLAASAMLAFRRLNRRSPGDGPESMVRACLAAALFTAASLFAYVKLGALFPAGPLRAVFITASAGAFMGAFFFGGYVIAYALSLYASDASRLYWYDLMGAGAGCGLAVVALDQVPTPIVILGCALLLASAATLLPQERALRVTGTCVSCLVGGLIAAAAAVPGLVRIDYAKSQDMSKVLWERWNSLAWVTVSSEVSGVSQAIEQISRTRDVSPSEEARLRGLWRAGWGMSARFHGPVPDMRYVTLDADAGTQIIEGGRTADLSFLEWDDTASPYVLRRENLERAFVIGGGGGRDVLTALSFGARDVDVAELNPAVIEAVQEAFGEFSGGIYDAPDVHLEIGDARSVLARSAHLYDVIQMSMVDTWAAAMSGAMSLAENTLYTQEAFELYVSRLRPDGLLALSRWYDDTRWGETARAVRMAVVALEADGATDPGKHIAVFYTRGYLGSGVATIIVKRTPLLGRELEVPARHARDRGFERLWPNPLEVRPMDLARVIAGDASYFDEIVYDLRPSTDQRPFFFSVRKPIQSWIAAVRTGDPTVGSIGFMVLAATLVGLLLGSRLLLWRPLRAVLVELSPEARPSRAELVGPALYFGGIGLGFVLVELALIQRFMVFLGHPTRAISVVLFTLLAASGLGSALSARVSDPGRAARVLIVPILAGILCVALALPPLLEETRTLTLTGRVLVVIATITPLALCMGCINPLGIRALAGSGAAHLVPWAWGVNGALGVVGSAFAVIVATFAGYTAVLCVALLAYAITLRSLWHRWPRQ